MDVGAWADGVGSWLAGQWPAARALWVRQAGWMAGLGVAFALLTRLTPCNRGMGWWKDLRAARTDLVYWLLVPLVLGSCRWLMVVVGVALIYQGGVEPPGTFRTWPLWLQCAAVLVIQDVLLYWLHRGFHTRPGWAYHAAHHSPKELDWVSTSRTHPVNFVLEFVLVDVVVLLMGFPFEAVAALVPVNTLYSAMVHANLNWTFGPLRYVFASPVFHRWHHTTEAEGLDKNFASTFPVLDLLFGTFYMPADRLPARFGTGDPDYPEGFWGQFVYPARRGQVFAWARAHPALAGAAAAVLVAAGFRVSAGLQPAPVPADEPPPEPVWAAVEPPPPPVRLLGRGVTGVAVTADGRRYASAGEDGTVNLVDIATMTPGPYPAGHRRRASAVAVTADGSRVVSASYDGTVRVWDGQSGRCLHTLAGHDGVVLSVGVTADGRTVVSGGADGTARVWAGDGTPGEVYAVHAGAVPGVAVSGDGKRVAAAAGPDVKVRDAGSGRELVLAGHRDVVCGVALTPDGGRVVSGGRDGRVVVWDGTTGREVIRLDAGGPVCAVAVSPDGRTVAAGGEDRVVRVWDLAAGREPRAFTGHAEAVTAVSVSGDGRRVVSGSRDGGVRWWRVGDGDSAAAGR
jgi:sterol desaturase/sphingolipid hydroxylase (fatty acid hydroxylase superfamily)